LYLALASFYIPLLCVLAAMTWGAMLHHTLPTTMDDTSETVSQNKSFL
jgi:hypothetical protein